jgi:hypothetical protein
VLVHALGVDYQHYFRQQAEVIVDTVTYIVCAGAGLDVGGESIPCVGWGEDGALAAVTEFATLIDGLATQIERPGSRTRSREWRGGASRVHTHRDAIARSVSLVARTDAAPYARVCPQRAPAAVRR